MNTVVDLFVIYKLLRKFVTPFTSYPAFKMGIIDSNGNFLKSRDQMSSDEKRNITYLDVFAINIKKLLGKIPGGKSQLATFAAALLFLRQKPIREDIEAYMDMQQLEIDLLEQIIELEEEISSNNASGGEIAGIGQEPKGEPGFTPKIMNKYKRKTKKDTAKIVTLLTRVRKG